MRTSQVGRILISVVVDGGGPGGTGGGEWLDREGRDASDILPLRGFPPNWLSPKRIALFLLSYLPGEK